jgi:MarR family transcriptional regulator, organic hydroperoxide resistance regulator
MKRSAKAAANELTESLDFLIRDTRLLLTNQIESRIAQQGIPLRIWFPLRILYQNEGITQRELGRMLGYGDAHAGVIVRVMQRRRLVSRRTSRVDKRRIDLYLTPAGTKMARQSLRLMRTINAQIISGFNDAEVRALKALLLRARENLKASSCEVGLNSIS